MAPSPLAPPRPSAAISGRPQVVQGFFAGNRPHAVIQPHRPGAVQPRVRGSAMQLPPGTLTLRPHGTGQRLPEAVQRKMSDLFKADFSDVRVHVGNEAASIGALAFTHGSDLYFAPGQYNPHAPHGQRLIAHELTHVIQQRAGRVRNPFGAGVAVVQDPGLEAEAESMGRWVDMQRYGGSILSSQSPPQTPARTPILPASSSQAASQVQAAVQMRWVLPMPIQRASSSPVPPLGANSITLPMRNARPAASNIGFKSIIQPVFDKLGKSQLGRARRHLFSSEVTIRITEPIEIKKIERKIGLLNRELKIFDDISSSKDANAQKSSLKGLYGIMNTIKLFLDEQLSKIPFDKAHDDKIIANYLLVLTHLEKRFWELAGRLNEAAAKLLKVSRVGPGERPDAYKGPKPELKLTKEERAFLDAFTKAKSDKPKSIEEAYTGIFAMRTYKDFEKIAPWQGKGDVEYSVGGKPWDQKVVYWGETEFDGRLKTTHTKFGFATHNQKVGILMDVTFVKKKNYEKTWLKVFGEILGGDIASEYIREVKNKDAAGLIAALHVNLNEKPKTCIERNIIFMEQVAKESKPFCTISSKELDKEHLRNIINGTKAPFCLHSNNRGWLPMNIAYFEYSISKKEFKGKLDSTTAKYVVSTDRKHIYLTPSHYKGFTITTKAKEKKNRPPFYRVLLSDDLKSEGKKMNLNKK